MKFKVGDRVSTEYGKGTIKFIDDDSTPYAVEYDEKLYFGHSCDGNCKDSYGYWRKEEQLTLIEETTPIKDIRLDKLKQLIKAVNTLGEFGKEVELKITIELDGKKIEL
jgi:hypothetical protein